MYIIKGNVLKISIRNLVEFICRSGDIESGTGRDSVKAMQEGARLHRKIQKSMGALYHAEVPLKIDLENNNYTVHLEGRADGIICDLSEDGEGNRTPLSDVTVDEIKTIMCDVEKMEKPIYVHEAQAKCYAYIYALQKGLKNIAVQLTYCNPETEAVKRFKTEYNFSDIESWFLKVMGEFYRWCDFIFEAREVRQQSIAGLEFPFEYRKGQRNLVVSVYKSIEQARALYIQAPTGVGKTLSTVFPSVAAMGQGMLDKIFYLTSKTITRKVAEDTFELLRDKGLKFRAVTLTAKDKLCLCDERKCNPVDCPYAKGHYDRVNEAIYDVISNNYVIDRDCITGYALKHEVCPFEMALDISYWCDGIICDYNYVFDPNVSLRRYFSDGAKGDYVFLVDEAHNLVDRAREMYSAVLVKEEFLKVKRLIKDVDKRLSGWLDKCNKEMLEMKRQCDTMRILEDCGRFPAILERLAAAMQIFFERHRTFPDMEEVLQLFFDVKHFINMHDNMQGGYVIYTEHNSDGNFCIRLFCVDPSDCLKGRFSQGRAAVLFSATLLPVNYYKEMLTGNKEDYAVYAESSFDPDKRCVLVGQDVSSRYTRRNENEYRKVCGYIKATAEAKPGKYMVFFPSYSYMDAVFKCFCDEAEYGSIDSIEAYGEDGEELVREMLGKPGIHIALQNTKMRDEDKERFLGLFDNYDCGGALVGFCVMGGVFSEGIDLRNDSLIGVIIVGTGLPMICRERDILRGYFDGCGKDGFSYAYVYPGMNKVQQAAGRVIRTHEDVGVIELLDDRFLRSEYRALYPREWTNVTAVTMNNVGRQVENFWTCAGEA